MKSLETAVGKAPRCARLLPFVLLLGALSLCGGAVHAATFEVTNTADGGTNGTCDAFGVNDGCTLREAISAADSATGDDTITFRSNVSGTITLGGTELSLNSNITITGPGANQLTVSGNDASRVFNIASGALVSITDLTCTRGNNSGNGGNIHNSGTLNITRCAITNGTAGNVGGGIFTLNSTLNIVDSSIAGNNGRFGGGIFVSSSTATFTNTTISNNTASPSVGGIYLNIGTVNLRSSTVSNNTAIFAVGGIYNSVSTGTFNIGNSIIAGNNDANGRPDIAGDAPITSQGYNLIGNTTGATINGDTTGNILNQSPRLAPLGNYGGATATHALLSGSPAINAGTSTNAPTADQRGAARVGNVDIGAFELNNSANGGNQRFALPSAPQFSSYSYTLVPNTTFSGTTFTYTHSSGTLPSGLQLTTSSGVVTLAGTPTQLGTSNFSITAAGGGNTNVTDYSLTVVDGTPPDTTLTSWPPNPSRSPNATFTFTGSDNVTPFGNLSYEYALDNGAFTPSVSPQAFFNLADGFHIFQVRAIDAGGNADPTPASFMWTIDATAPTVVLSSSAPSQTNAAFEVTATFSESVSGFVVTDITVTNGSASNFAGSGNLYTFTVTPSAPGVVSVRIPASAAQDSAGNNNAISNLLTRQFNNLSTLVVTKTADTDDGVCDADCSLREAISAATAGNTITFASPLFDSPQTITLALGELVINKNLTITGPGAAKLSISGNNASRIFNISSGTVTLSGLNLTQGSASDGAAIHNAGALTINDAEFRSNKANLTSGAGGAIFNAGSLSVARTLFHLNEAFLGGAINSDNNLTVSDANFSGNHAAFNGGALRLFGSASISGSTFSNNSADNGGGAVMSHGDLTLTNATLAHNTALDGGAIQAWENTVDLRYVTLAYNAATRNGGGIDIVGATVTAKNTIVAGNAAATGADVNGALAVASANNLLNQSATAAGLGTLASNGGPTATIALLAGSPAINAGATISGITTDQRGIARPQYGAVDIGAYEFNSATDSLVVTTTADEDNGTSDPALGSGTSLREAINYANSNAGDDTISFASPLFNSAQTITLGGTQLSISSNVSITGPGAKLLTVSGNNASRVLNVGSGSTVALSGLTVTNGRANDGSGIFKDGSGISNAGTLTVERCAISGNTGGGNETRGVGVFNTGLLTVTNSTISGNLAAGEDLYGGGLYNTGGTVTLTNCTISGNNLQGTASSVNLGGGVFSELGPLTLINSTVTSNTAVGGLTCRGGGIFRNGNTVSLRNTIVAGNSVSGSFQNFGPDIYGTVSSQGYNLIGNTGFTTINGDTTGNLLDVNPQLGALADNGGPTQTHALQAGSPAINAGNNSGAPATDQRGTGFPRIQVNRVDIGAFELDFTPTESLVVTTTADEDNGTSDPSFGSGTSLREAIAYANSNADASTITFHASLAGQTATLNNAWGSADGYEQSSALRITSPVTVQGISGNSGVTLQVSNAVSLRHFVVNGGVSLTLENLTLGGGKANTAGFNFGGSVWNFGSLTVRGCTFTGNSTSGEGGAIQSWGDSPLLLIENSTFSGNTSTGIASVLDSGAVNTTLRNVTMSGNTGPQALVFWKYAATLKNCLIAGNSNDGIESANGGSLDLAQSTNNLIGSGNTLGLTNGSNGNQIGVSDAKIGTLASNGGPTQTFALLSGSPAINAGVAISGITTDQRAVARPQYGLVDIGAYEFNSATESLIVTTTADEDNGTSDPTIGSGTSLREAIAYANAKAGDDTISFSSLFDSAQTITLGGTEIGISSNLTITGPGAAKLSISGNDASRIFNIASGTVALSGLTLTQGSASDGAAIYNAGALTINDAEFRSNKANLTSGAGGAILNSGSLSVARTLFYLNEAFLGGAINSSDGLTVSDCTFSGNHAAFNGGALRLFGSANISGSTFSNNSADNGGGAVISHGDLTLTNSTLGYNTALDGGAIQAWENTVDLRHVTLAYNAATRNGGGIDIVGATTTAKNTIVAGNAAATGADVNGALAVASANNLLNQSATAAGLGTLASNGGPTQTIALLAGSPAINAGVAIGGITTDQRGAGFPRIRFGTVDIGAFESSFTPNESLIVTTTADEDDGTSDPTFGTGTSLREAIAYANAKSGADIITFNSGVTGTISLGTALPDLSDDVTITGPGANVLTVQRSTAGGTPNFRIFTVNAGKTVTLSGLTVRNGNADTGGGISNSGALTVANCTISGNSALNGGGINSIGTLIVNNSTFSGNSVLLGGGGGGITSFSTSTVTNCTISGNSAGHGGGINNWGTMTVANCTISGNSADLGGGIFCGATLNIGNTIVNQGSGFGENYYIGGPTPNSQGYNISSDGTGPNNGTTDRINTDPLLGALADNGGPTQTHALLTGSPAINAGSGNQTTDQRGVARPQGTRRDIGAYEYDAFSESLIVTTTADEDNGTSDPTYGNGTSLREAIAYANAKANTGVNTPDEITFSSLFNSAQTITLSSALPNLSDAVKITGPGANLLSVKASTHSFNILTVNSGKSLTLNGLSLKDGGNGIVNDGGTVNATNCAFNSNGRGISNDAGTGTVTATNCTFSGNTDTGLYSNGTATAINCTFSGNFISIWFSTLEGAVTVTNCTLSGNSFGAISGGGFGVTLKNSICAGNGTNTIDATDGGNNIIGGTAAAAGLETTDGNNAVVLKDNGGPTQTIALVSGSPAINAGTGSGAPSIDQRGVARPQYGAVDIGAFEFNSATDSLVVTTTADEDNGTSDPAFGDGTSLREAMNYANAHANGAQPDEITFDSGVFGTAKTIALGSILPAIADDVKITGPGANLLTIRGGGTGAFDNLTVNSSKSLTVSGMTLTNGRFGIENSGTVTATNCSFSDNQRGINNNNGGVATVTGCTFSGNVNGIGNNFTSLTTATNCTFSGNTNATFVSSGCTLTATNCTFSGNDSGVTGNGSMVLKNTLCVGNTTNTAGTISGSNNILSGTAADAGLDPNGLQDNGGPTKTIALVAGSPAFNGGTSSGAPSTDQRGVARPQANRVDIGAFELQLTVTESLIVTTAADEDNGTSDPTIGSGTSLREAMNYANAHANGAQPDEITFSSLFNSAQTITLGSALPVISDNVTITGSGANLLTLRCSSAGAFDNLTVNSGKSLTVSGMTLSNGRYGINNAGTATVTSCSFNNNQRGIENFGTTTATNCTFSGNINGIGIDSGTTTITNCTFSGNTNGIFNSGGTTLTAMNCTFSGNDSGVISSGSTVLKNTICAGNTTNTSGTISGSNNILSGTAADAGLDPNGLQDNGGPTKTIALVAGSPAFNGGTSSGAPSTDQRGIARPQANLVDIGAFELQLTVTESLIVTTAADEDNGTSDPTIGSGTSLREAINYANAKTGDDTITFSSLFDTAQTITLGGSELTISSSLTISGPGANKLSVSGNDASRVFNIGSGAHTVTLQDFTVTRGRTSTGGAGLLNASTATVRIARVAFTSNVFTASTGGGGIRHAGARLDLEGCLFSANGASGTAGGGVFCSGSTAVVNAVNCTFVGNLGNLGGGVHAHNSGSTVNLTNCTLTGNAANGANANNGAQLSLRNTIVAGNTGDDVRAPSGVTSAGYNLIGTATGVTGFVASDLLNVASPGLGTLADNGGPTQTIALLTGSPAINAGSNTLAKDANGNDLTTDARGAGFPRIIGATVDIGAFEFQSNLLLIATNQGLLLQNGATATIGNTLLKVTDSDGDPVTYTLTAVPTKGTLKKNNVALAVNDTFTQSDIDSNLLSFTAGATLGADSFDFSATDGNGASVTGTFNIAIVETLSLVVTTRSDASTNADGQTSLREAITYANSKANGARADEITFYIPDAHKIGGVWTINLNSALPNISDDVTITGPGAKLLAVRGGGTSAFSVFTVNSSKNATFNGLTISNGFDGISNKGTATVTNSTLGGNSRGVFNDGGTVTVTNSTLSENRDAGIYNFADGGTVTVTNSTFSGNDYGINNARGTATVTNCTLSGNTRDGIRRSNGTVTLKNSIVAGNATNTSGTITDGGNNITTGTAAAAGLNPAGLQDNGGPTQTIALISGSPAINAGSNTNASGLGTDQRGKGFARIKYGTVDIGAYEFTGAVESLVVTTIADENNGSSDPSFGSGTSLREAISAANARPGDDTITFATPLFSSAQTIQLGSALPGIYDNVTITGPGANLLTIRGGGTDAFPIFTVNSGKNAAFSGLTITNGNRAIYNSGPVTVTNCTLSGNSFGLYSGSAATVNGSTLSGNFSGIFHSAGAATVTNCTISGNSLYGIVNANFGTATVTNSTLSGNKYGIRNNGNTATLKNSIVAGNTINTIGTITNGGNNITTGTAAAAGLDPAGLQDNGGPTQTIALVAGSPAINAGSNANASGLGTDQRGVGFPRNVGSRVDIGAFESQNTAPTASNQSVTVNQNVAKLITLGANDIDGDTLSFTITAQPANGTLTNENGSALVNNKPTSNKVQYTPNTNYVGGDSFTFKANDGTADSNAATVSITVYSTNSAPTASGQNVVTDEDTPKLITLGASDADNDTLTFTITQQPARGTLTNENGSAIVNNQPSSNKVRYTPAANYPLDTMLDGSDSFRFKANDGKADSNVATVSITVAAVCDAPLAVGDSYSVNQDGTLTVGVPGVLLNDTELDGDALTAIKLSDPQHGTLTFNANGSFVYKPDAGYAGMDSFTYKASDGFLDSGPATVSLTVFATLRVTMFTPAGGGPGTVVTVNGSGFVGASEVRLNGVSVGAFTVVSANKLTFVVPANASSGTISVITAAGTASSNKEFVVAPRLTSYSPGSGVVGSNVTVTGANLAHVTSARLNGIPCAILSRSAGSLTFKVAEAASTGKISLSNVGGTATSSTDFVVLPRLGNFTPSEGGGESRVTIRGNGFTSATEVRINGILAPIVSRSATELVVVVPLHATTGTVTVTTGAHSVTSTRIFTVLPMVVRFTPGSGAVGSFVTITGSLLSGATDVRFNGRSVGAGNFSVVSGSNGTQLRAKVPAGASTGRIAVVTPLGTASSAGSFTVTP